MSKKTEQPCVHHTVSILPSLERSATPTLALFEIMSLNIYLKKVVFFSMRNYHSCLTETT